MLVTNLETILSDFCNKEEKSKTMLIDGKWGCGKTFNVGTFLDKSKQNSIYISLFGMKERDEINVRLSEYLDSSYLVTFNGKSSVRTTIREKNYNGLLIIFDDLERTSGLSFSDVCGIVDSLSNLGFKVVCICDSTRFDDKKSFSEYKEKTFDSVIGVEADAQCFSQVTGIDVGFEKTLLDNVNGNWRTIKRASYNYYALLNYAKNNGIEDFCSSINLSGEALFRIVALATQCFYSNIVSSPSFGEDAFNFAKLEYEEDKNKFGKYAANALYDIFCVKKENFTYKEMVKNMLVALMTHNYQSFVIESMPIKQSNFLSEYPFNKEVFYLDDKGHEEYKKAFFDKLNLFDFSDNYQKRSLTMFITNYLEELTKAEEQTIISHIVGAVPSNESDDFLEMLFPSSTLSNKKLASFKDLLLKAFAEKEKKERLEFISGIVSSKDYGELTNFLYKNKSNIAEKKNIVLKALKENDFCLPDLSKEVDHEIWGYCHEAARFVAGTNYQDDYINVLKKQCEESSSKELRKKCHALVYYNFNTQIDFTAIKTKMKR